VAAAVQALHSQQQQQQCQVAQLDGLLLLAQLTVQHTLVAAAAALEPRLQQQQQV
jgi:hypothetical protein